MSNNNIIKCSKCRLYYIEEESHNCVSGISKYLFCTDGTFSPDGKKWYKISPTDFQQQLPTENQQRNKTTDEETEPKFLI